MCENVVDDDGSSIQTDDVGAGNTYGWVHRLRMFLLTTSLGKVVDGGNVLLSAVYCVVYVVEASGGKNVSPEGAVMLSTIMGSCCAFFGAYFLLSAALARNKKEYLTSVNCYLDLGSFVPYLLAWTLSGNIRAAVTVANGQGGDFVVLTLKAFAMLRFIQLEMASQFVSQPERKQMLAYVHVAPFQDQQRRSVPCSVAHYCKRLGLSPFPPPPFTF